MSWRQWVDETFPLDEIAAWELLFTENDDVIYREILADEGWHWEPRSDGSFWWTNETD